MKTALLLTAITSLLLIACENGEAPHDTVTCPNGTTVETTSTEMAQATTWTYSLPIREKGKTFIELRVICHTTTPWAPKDFTKKLGQDEHGNPEMIITGYVEGPELFQVKIPTDIKQVKVEVRFPTIKQTNHEECFPTGGTHKFTVTPETALKM